MTTVTVLASVACYAGETPLAPSDADEVSASLARVGPPSDFCSAPPEIRQIVSRPMREPPPGEFNNGQFLLMGSNFQQGDVFVDGPLVVVGESWVNRPGNLIKRDWRIGCCAPEPGFFNVFVVTPCGSDQMEFEIVGEDVPE